MHNYLVNAAIQLIPVLQDKHPYKWIDEVIEKLIMQSNLTYEVNAFATVVEGKYTEVMQLIDTINEYLVTQHCHEWICNIQLQLRADADITADEKTAKFR